MSVDKKILGEVTNIDKTKSMEVMDPMWLTQAMGKLQSCLGANENAIKTFEEKKADINGRHYSALGHIINPLNEALDLACKGDIKNLAWELRLKPIADIQKENENEQYERAQKQAAKLAAKQSEVAHFATPAQKAPTQTQTAWLRNITHYAKGNIEEQMKNAGL